MGVWLNCISFLAKNPTKFSNTTIDIKIIVPPNKFCNLWYFCLIIAYPQSNTQGYNPMKKFTALSLAFCTVLAMTSQATTTPIVSPEADTSIQITVADEQNATATADTTTADTTTTNSSEPVAPETPTTPTISPQVQKLIQLYPRLVARIQPHGKICFEGEECDVNISVLTASADGSPRDGQTIYKAVCHTCHATGLVGAPKYGNQGDWASRIAKGKDTLYHNAINGFNAMPARGGADIPDEEVQNAVDYMIEAAS